MKSEQSEPSPWWRRLQLEIPKDDQEMEHFLSILHTQLRALDTDISQDLASKAKASKAKQRRSSLRGLDAESLSILGSREDAALLEAGCRSF